LILSFRYTFNNYSNCA